MCSPMKTCRPISFARCGVPAFSCLAATLYSLDRSNFPSSPLALRWTNKRGLKIPEDILETYLLPTIESYHSHRSVFRIEKWEGLYDRTMNGVGWVFSLFHVFLMTVQANRSHRWGLVRARMKVNRRTSSDSSSLGKCFVATSRAFHLPELYIHFI